MDKPKNKRIENKQKERMDKPKNKQKERKKERKKEKKKRRLTGLYLSSKEECMSRKREVTERSRLVTYGTGPLACLSLFPVAELDKESWD